MPDRASFSAKLLAHAVARNDAALDRITIAKNRIQSILDREIVAHQKTLEQKISEQGPDPLRVDPHLVGLAIRDLVDLNRLREHRHQPSRTKSWFANPGTTADAIAERLNELGPLYASITGQGFGNLSGDALEVVVFKCLQSVYEGNPRYAYQGLFHLDQPKDDNGRYRKIQPPKTIGARISLKEADFLQFGHTQGPLCIECKNYREWIYPHHSIIAELIRKSADLGAIPVLVARRFHYTTRTNFLEPAGIIAHESYLQYYPSDKAALAEKVRHKRMLGFTDVTATEEPHERTKNFFLNTIPNIVDRMAAKWKANEAELLAYANEEMNLAQLYNAIGSPAAGNWQEFEAETPDEI
jgi:hypothetical protein